MSIEIQCSQCGRNYQVSEAVAGKRVRCRQCGAAIAVPDLLTEIPDSLEPPAPPLRQAADLSGHPAANPMLSSPPLYQQPPGQAWQWGAGSYAAGGGRRRGIDAPLAIVSMIALAWAGYAIFQGLEQVDALAVIVDRLQGQALVMIGLVLLLRVGQLFAAAGIIVGLGAVYGRLSWGGAAAVISAAVYFGMACAWVPLTPVVMAMGMQMMDDFMRPSRLLLRMALEYSTHLIVPAIGVVVLARLDQRKSRDRWPCFRILVGTAALGWSVYALTRSAIIADAFLTLLERVGDRATGNFYVILGARVVCVLAAIALGIAAGGVLARQEWSVMTGMIGAGVYLAAAATIVAAVLYNRPEGGNMARGLSALVSIDKELLVPACFLGWFIWAQNADW